MTSRRRLSSEEDELWTHVTKNVKRLRPAPRKAAAAVGSAPEPPLETKAKKPAKTTRAAPTPSAPPKPALKPLVPLEPKTKRKLSRGQTDVAARIDLHGMRQHQAHDALMRFILDAHANDARLVLVITGKGKSGRDDRVMSEREVGVLRRIVPHWLSEPSLRQVVLGYEGASIRHGGEGAIYVRLRKRGAL